VDVRENHDESGVIEPLNSDESSLSVLEVSLSPVVVISPSPSDRTDPTLPEEIIMASLEALPCCLGIHLEHPSVFLDL
jgi:hypothetical protein